MAVRRQGFASCGRDVRFDPFGSYTPADRIHIGSRVFIGPGARISASEGMTIGDNVIIGPDLCVMGGDHSYSVPGRVMYEVKDGGVNLPVVVESDVGLGARVTLLKGVTVREGTVVGAGSVVTHTLPPYTIAAGSPCRVLRTRFGQADLASHLAAVASPYCVEDVLREWRAAGLTPA